MGRPKHAKGEARGMFYSARFTVSEFNEIAEAIKRDRTKKPEWVRNSLLAAARKCAQ